MPDTLKLVALGAGNLASHLVPALDNIGCDILQVYSRSIYNANSLAHSIDSEATADLAKINKQADLYLFMLKDDALEDFLKVFPSPGKNALFVHTAGAKSIEVFREYTNNYACLYPLQSFRKKQSMDMSSVPFLVNANNDFSLRNVRMLARKISHTVNECSDEDRLRYHLSAVLVNNFTNHLHCLANNFLEEYALDSNLLKPIISTGYEKIIDGDPCKSQTGPAQRGDLKLIRKHLQLIKSDSRLSLIYKTISDSITENNKTDNEDR